MGSLFTPRGFLLYGGIVLVLVAVLGYVGVIGPGANGIFGSFWYFDNAENIAHLVLGVVALGAVYMLGGEMQKPLVILVGLLAVVIGLYSLVYSSSLLGANLENPADSILHLVIGAWALYAAFAGGKAMGQGGMM